MLTHWCIWNIYLTLNIMNHLLIIMNWLQKFMIIWIQIFDLHFFLVVWRFYRKPFLFFTSVRHVPLLVNFEMRQFNAECILGPSYWSEVSMHHMLHVTVQQSQYSLWSLLDWCVLVCYWATTELLESLEDRCRNDYPDISELWAAPTGKAITLFFFFLRGKNKLLDIFRSSCLIPKLKALSIIREAPLCLAPAPPAYINCHSN